MTTIEYEREIQNVQRLAEKVHGWLTADEGDLLFRLARNVTARMGVIVEIGSWKGKSTIFLARGSLAGSRVRVYAVDPHTGSEVHRQMWGRVATFPEFQ